MSHVLQTGSPVFNYTHQQLTFLLYQEAIEKKGLYIVPLLFPPSIEAAGVNRPQQFVVIMHKQTENVSKHFIYQLNHSYLIPISNTVSAIFHLFSKMLTKRYA